MKLTLFVVPRESQRSKDEVLLEYYRRKQPCICISGLASSNGQLKQA